MKNGKSVNHIDKNEEYKIAAFLTAFFFAFNIGFFGPAEMYLTNISDILVCFNNILIFFGVISSVIFAVLLTALLLTKKKPRINNILFCIIWGSAAALYIQGNYLQIGSTLIDGTQHKTDILKSFVNILIWTVIISVPFLVDRFRKEIFIKFISFTSAAITVIEIVTLCILPMQITQKDDTGVLADLLTSTTPSFSLNTENLHRYSSTENYIIILTDEYDSFCFDNAVSAEPECISGFDGFTYFKDTLGMYGFTSNAIPHILSGIEDENGNGLFQNDLFFSTLKNNDYEIEIYATNQLLDQNIYKTYASNYSEDNGFDFRNMIKTGKYMSKLTMYKYSPELFKPLFWTYSNEDSSNGKAYYADDLTFYNGIPDTVEFTDKKCFKFIYLYGLHDPRNITADLQRAPDWSISGDEQAVALNKILSYYFDVLRNNGIYDNADIVVLADHGLKANEGGKYPFLMIKRESDQLSEFITSDVPVSYSDVYPTLIEIAGADSGQATVYEIEREERERYFAGTDEYIIGTIKN